MKRFISKIMVFVLVMVMLLAGEGVKIEAASYPSVFFFADAEFKDLIVSTTANVGDTVYIRMDWWAEYNHEGYDMVVYNSDNQVVASTSDTWSNLNYERHIT